MNENLKTPNDLGVKPPQLKMIASFDQAPAFQPVNVPWKALAACEKDEHNEDVGGIRPATPSLTDNYTTGLDNMAPNVQFAGT